MDPNADLPPQQIPTNRGSGTSFMVLIVAAAVVIMVGIAACGGAILFTGLAKSTAASSITLDSGRVIRVTTDSSGVGATSTGDTGTFDLGPTQIVVKPDSVTLNGVQVAELDPAAMVVEISFTSGEVRVTSNNAVVGSAERTTVEPNNNSP
ncbi:MAG: hypothetical protein AB8B50_16875 [Pirellulaceae bacterium]